MRALAIRIAKIVLCAMLLWPQAAAADCPYRPYKDIAQEANDRLRDAPIVFIGEVMKTRLVGKLGDASVPRFEDVYRVIDVIKGASPKTVTLGIGTIGDGDEPPATQQQVDDYIKGRRGRKLIVLTFSYMDSNGKPILIASGDCPLLPDADNPHGRALVDAMKKEVRTGSR